MSVVPRTRYSSEDRSPHPPFEHHSWHLLPKGKEHELTVYGF